LIEEEIPIFLDYEVAMTSDSQFQSDEMFNRTLAAKLYNAGKRFVNSEYMHQNHVDAFLSTIGHGKIVIELGSGNRRLHKDIINLDLFRFPNVDIVGDVAKIPLKECSVDFIILDTVLEHVPEPHAVVNETYRILKENGQIITIVPWVFPYHGYPKNYFNISEDGLQCLFRKFSECNVYMSIGPTCALTNLISEYFAVAFSSKNKMAYTFFKGLSLLPICFLKYFDRLWSSEESKRISSTLCAIAKK
jgi:SAM-dependent methyltransferase